MQISPTAPAAFRSAGRPPAPSDPAVRILARDGGGWLEDHSGHLVLHTSGTPYEEGYQHGHLLRQQVRDCFHEVFEEGFFKGNALFPRWLWYVYARFNQRHFTSQEREELKGLADGSGLRYADILVMNSQGPIDIVHNWFTPGGYGHCTQFIATGPATADGRMLAGRNLDTVNLNRLQQYEVVQVHHPDRGYAFATPGFAGKVLDAVTGWNEKGLQVCQDDADARWENACGVYSGALVRRLVQHCATLEGAEQAVRHLPRLAAAGKNITAADGRDARVIEVEQNVLQGLVGRKTVEARGLGGPHDPAGTAMLTNHYTTPDIAARAPQPSTSSQMRYDRVHQLVGAQYGSLDVDRAKNILTDKLDLATMQPGGPQRPSDNIINWYGPRVTAFGPFPVNPRLEVRVTTTYSTITDFGRGVMWIGGGKSYVDSPADYFPLNVPQELAKKPPA